jgi:hypothetical protein
LPEGRCLWLSATVDLLHHAAQCKKQPVPSNGTAPKKIREK